MRTKLPAPGQAARTVSVRAEIAVAGMDEILVGDVQRPALAAAAMEA